jgi:hypothetical protein
MLYYTRNTLKAAAASTRAKTSPSFNYFPAGLKFKYRRAIFTKLIQITG